MKHIDGWVSVTDHQPEQADGDENGPVFVWHVYQGAMLTPRDKAHKNRFHTHWMPVKRATENGWIDVADRIPTAEDADELRCVLVYHRYDGNKITGWHQVEADRQIDRWLPLPRPPDNYRELRRCR